LSIVNIALPTLATTTTITTTTTISEDGFSIPVFDPQKWG